ncbi:5-oxoprolinase subunit B family protein [Mongoliitalea daihaiensis]|uniref:5-oxoprolinase subunit B family protein n=1 Tax=Mongoliitalea daihaiensis TaxID=2782006 RepID=UPI001F3AB6BE|nr:allophanate hydrolase subunit 1 [Mongoliitalea daihaiensis]UJP64109.1 allophanate hydrolase subunit 1 [Mongoliitalea daihaiensis]
MSPILEKIWIHPALLELRWEAKVHSEILKMQESLYTQLLRFAGIQELRIGFHTLTILFEELQSAQERYGWEKRIEACPIVANEYPSQHWRIPVCYELGKDLQSFATSKDMTPKDVIELHSKPFYLLHFYGFLPGFMYLGGLDNRLVSNRKSIPDRRVEAGSVGIGGSQTGIYTLPSPGGWHIIGKTPLNLFEVEKTPPVQPKIGDRISFYPIEKDEFDNLSQLIKSEMYEWRHE